MDALERFRNEFKGWVWSHFQPMGKEISNQMANALSTIGISLDTSKEWAFWKREKKVVTLQNEDPLEIARMVAAAISLKA